MTRAQARCGGISRGGQGTGFPLVLPHASLRGAGNDRVAARDFECASGIQRARTLDGSHCHSQAQGNTGHNGVAGSIYFTDNGGHG
jgi:hypothetical protein